MIYLDLLEQMIYLDLLYIKQIMDIYIIMDGYRNIFLS